MVEQHPERSRPPVWTSVALVLIDALALGGGLALSPLSRPGFFVAFGLASSRLLGLQDPRSRPRRDTRLVASILAVAIAAAGHALVLGQGRPPVLGLLVAVLAGQIGREVLILLLAIRARPLVIQGRGPGARELARALRRPGYGSHRLVGFLASRGSCPEGVPRLEAVPEGALLVDGRAVRYRPGGGGREAYLEVGGLEFPVAEGPGDGTSRMLKRLLDLALVVASLPLSLPLFLLAWLANRLVQGAPALHSQTRVTRGERVFRIYKLRSMAITAEPDGRPVWPAAEDARITGFGRFLRRSWLDELPQLWNVLRGDLSLVGPRPERPEFVQVFKTSLPRYSIRHRSLAGITGLAQVRGFVGNTSLRKRLLSDLHYIESWSIWLDVAVLGRTLCQVIQRRQRPRFDYVPGDEGRIP